MKKWLIRVAIVLVVLVILVAVGISVFLDSAIKRGVETAGPRLAKVPVQLEMVNLSLFSGSGKLKGLVVGNPEGFKTPSAIKVGTASLALEPRSLFADKVIIHTINIQGPEITYETDLRGNNLSKILSNVEGSTSGGEAAPKPNEPAPVKQAKATKKLQVDDFVITGGKINVTLNALGTSRSASVALPEIHLTGLGQGPEGITPAELAKRVLQVIEKEAMQASTSTVADLSKQATQLTKGLANDLQKSGGNAASQISKGLGGLFPKK